MFFCPAAGLRSGSGRSEPGEVLPEPAEGGFSRPDVSERQPGGDGPSPAAVAPQEEGKAEEEEVLPQGAEILSVNGAMGGVEAVLSLRFYLISEVSNRYEGYLFGRKRAGSPPVIPIFPFS